MAEEGSFELFEHAAEGYPYRLAAHLEDPPEFWRLLEDLLFWSLQQIEASPESMPVETGIRWAAALDGVMREAGVAEEFWRYHAETLFPGLTAGQSEKQRIFAYLKERSSPGIGRSFRASGKRRGPPLPPGRRSRSWSKSHSPWIGQTSDAPVFARRRTAPGNSSGSRCIRRSRWRCSRGGGANPTSRKLHNYHKGEGLRRKII